jgi:hypothetical protein
MSAYETFADIPPEDRHEDALIAWMRAPGAKLSELPQQYLTTKLHVAVISSSHTLGDISFSTTANYREIVLESLRGNSELILQVEEDALNEPFLYAAVSLCNVGHYLLRNMLFECCDRFNRLITQRIMNKGLCSSLKTASDILTTKDLPIPQSIKDMVNDNLLKRALINKTGETYYLKRMGKLHLLTEAINDGYWPVHDMWLRRRAPDVLAQKPDLSVAIANRKRPDTSDSALGLFDRNFHAFFEAVILTFPIEEVLAKMTSREHVPILKELYSTEVLMPYLKQFPHLKSDVLEDAMGL